MKRFAPIVLLACFLVTVCAQPAFSLYKWVDEKGLLHITDYPPPSKGPAPEPEPPKPAAPAPVATPPSASAPPAVQTLPRTAPAMTAAATGPSTTSAAAATRPSATAAATPASASVPAPAPSAAKRQVPRPRQMPMPQSQIVALVGSLLLIFVLIGLVLYIFFSLCMYRIAKRLNVAEAWMSWVPVLNLWPFLSSAGKPCWWVVLLFIPLVNIIVFVHLWMCICENLGKNKWLGLLSLIDGGVIILPGYLAFSKEG